MNKEQLKEWAEAIYIGIDPASPFAPLQQKAADFLQSLADLPDGEPETAEINDGYDLLVTKKNRDWHIMQYAETKRKLDDAQQRIADLERDAKRIDWLELQHVEVRIPLMYGSRACFVSSPSDDWEDDPTPSDLRKAIDAAIEGDKL